MLSIDYRVKVNLAGRKFTTPPVRYKTVRELLEDHDAGLDVVDRSRVLFDAAKLLGLVDVAEEQGWKFTRIKSLPLRISLDVDDEGRRLGQVLARKIGEFGQTLFTNFEDFARFWNAREFQDAEDFLRNFYRYAPFAKLGLDDELCAPFEAESAADRGQLRQDLARQNVAIRRLREIILPKAPDDVPEGLRESLLDYALRQDEEAIPLSTKQGLGCDPISASPYEE